MLTYFTFFSEGTTGKVQEKFCFKTHLPANSSNGQTRGRNRLRRKWIKEIHPVGVIKHKDPEEVKKKVSGRRRTSVKRQERRKIAVEKRLRKTSLMIKDRSQAEHFLNNYTLFGKKVSLLEAKGDTCRHLLSQENVFASTFFHIHGVFRQEKECLTLKYAGILHWK